MVRKKEEKIFFWFNCIVIALSIYRIFLSTRIPLSLYTNQVYDDQLLFDYAENILEGGWLGEYSVGTLVKGVSYSLFLAVCHLLCIPYTIGLGILNVGSAYIFVRAIKDLIRNRYIRRILYLLLIYSPVTLALLISQRAYRMAIIPSAVLLVFGCFIGLYLRRDQKISSLLPWVLGSGGSLAFFWNIREDSIWILPFVLVLTIITIGYYVAARKKQTKLALRIVLCILPLGILYASQTGLSALNQKYYGIYTVNDRNSTGFGDMMSCLYKIEDTECPDYVWVSNKTMEAAMDASPTLDSIREEIIQSITAWGAGEYIDMRGDLISWALREAAEDAGYYTDAVETNEFFEKAAAELQNAIDTGELKTDHLFRFSNVADGIPVKELPALILNTFQRMQTVAEYEGTGLSTDNYGSGDTYDIRRAEVLLGSLGNYQISEFEINGWIYARNASDDLTVELVDQNGEYLDTLDFYESPDVYQANPESEHAKVCRFDQILVIPRSINVFLKLILNGQVLGTFEATELPGNTVNAWVETDYRIDPNNDAGQYAVAIGNRIVKIFKTPASVVNILAVILFLLYTGCLVLYFIRRGGLDEKIDLWLIIAALFLSAFVLTLGVQFFTSWFQEEMYPYINFYNAGSYPLLQCAKYLSIFAGVSAIIEMIVHKDMRVEEDSASGEQ
ncbi:MAG: hypothetical protein Q4B03_05050 [Lachnospiraceae bacterium]|nr:hypothetical protein [Lachnospiraceae bacterium]